MIRFSNKPNTFTLLDPGVYDFQITEVEHGTNKKNNPQLTIKSVVVGGKDDGRTIVDWFQLTEKAMWRIGLLVEATGCPHTVVGHGKDGNPEIEFDENDLVGLYFRADVTQDTYEVNGQKKDKNVYANFAPSDLGVTGAADEEQPEDEVEETPPPPPVQAAPQRRAPAPAGAGVARRPRGATA